MKTADIRKKFIQFFKERNHTNVPSASTIPIDDQTILFTVAGMTQFKNYFTGQKTAPFTRAVNSQKCIRVADLDDVGKDGRHLTMFEMLGNWSFGDYYKQEAISWAYEFVKDILNLDFSKIWVSVHHTDDESSKIWHAQGIPLERIVRLDDKDNFWAMGPTGPCGPCTEIYYDQGESVGSCYQANIACKGPGCECDRFLEFWNLVFIQFERNYDGKLQELPIKSVDGGMGLERLAALLQKKTNLFEIDTFKEISDNILKSANIKTQHSDLPLEQKECVHVIADHIRFLCFTIADGVHFSNEGRGYVLRRVLRRATRFAHKLCPDWPKNQSFLEKLVQTVVQQSNEYFPELLKSKTRIEEAIAIEEIKFNKTLESGLQKFNEFLNKVKSENKHMLPGEHVFVLHDTYGFPADLTKILCKENKFEIDMQGYENFMLEQKQKSRDSAKFYKFLDDNSPWLDLNPLNQNEDLNFNGYFLKTNFQKNNINYFLKKLSYEDIKKVRQLQNRSFELVIKNTPFYPEGGGQISDKGFIEIINGKNIFQFEVIDVKKTPAYITHILRHEEWSDQVSTLLSELELKNIFHSSIEIICYVNLSFRIDVARNHTATHLLHKSLKTVLGESVQQAGSLVKNDLLRFDFTYQTALTTEQLDEIENLVNDEILKNSLVYTHQNIPLNEAKKMSATALFNEKYDSAVRVLQIDNFSLELCGGTHVNYTGEIGQLKIISETGITNGVRRLEAVTGVFAVDYSRNLEGVLKTASDLLKSTPLDISKKIYHIKDHNKNLEKEIFELENKLANQICNSLLKSAQTQNELQIISSIVPDVSLKILEILCDKIKSKQNFVAILATILHDKVHIIAGMHQEILKKHKNIHLGKIVLDICVKLGGKGGGRPDFAKGSGQIINNLDEIFNNLII